MTQVPTWYTEFVGALVSRLPRDIDEATASGWMRDQDALESVLRGALLAAPAAGTAAPATVSAQLQHDKTQEGWTLVEDVAEPASITPETIELAAFPESDEGYILGDEMVTIAQGLDDTLGQRHAEYLLEHPESIPEDFKQFSVVFPGTIWLGRDGNHHVPCLTWSRSNAKWDLMFGILEAGVDSGDRYVRSRA